MGIFDADSEMSPENNAEQVYHDLMSFLEKNTPKKPIKPVLEDVRITLKSSLDRSLVIVTEGDNAFRVQENSGNLERQRQVYGVPPRWSLSEKVRKSVMVNRVKKWLSEP